MLALLRQPLLAIGFALVALQLALAAFAPLLAMYGPLDQDILARYQPPSLDHLLGTDKFGRDLFARILYGYRASLLVSGCAVAIALAVGGSLGVIAAYYRGWTERIVMRAMDILFAFPLMLLAIGVIAILGPQAWTTAIAIAVVYTPIFARLLRGPALVIVESDYVVGAKAVGASDARILLRHILPNLASVILVQASLLLSAAILVEASLSFLGLGVPEPYPSWGRMLSESAAEYMRTAPWLVIFPGVAISAVVFGANLFGDALRDYLDPRMGD